MDDITNVTPIRVLDDAQALDWLRAQPGGRTTLSGAELGRRWGWYRQRVSRALREWRKTGVVTRRGSIITVVANAPPTVPEAGTVPPVGLRNVPPVVSPREIKKTSDISRVSVAPDATGERRTTIDLTAYAAAIGLASCAAYFSIRGMTVLFPGSPQAIVVMAATMEAAKLVTAGWLARRWRATAWIWRVALIAFVLGLAAINAGGTYSQLVAAHVGERGAAQAGLEMQTADLEARIEVTAHKVADFDARVSQIDAAIAEATRRGRTTGAMSIMEAQRRTRAGLVDERSRADATLATLKAERVSLAARGRQAEVEAAPIRYVTELLGGGEDSERAIRWLIALMVLCCDPLAIGLTAAASARRSTTV